MAKKNVIALIIFAFLALFILSAIYARYAPAHHVLDGTEYVIPED